MMRLTVDGMMARGFGRIVNIVLAQREDRRSSRLGLSNGARSGLIGFVAGLARQTVEHNVTINNMLPGIVRHRRAEASTCEVLVRRDGKSVRTNLE